MTANGTIGWEFRYILSDKIDCNKDLHDVEGVKFVTNDEQNAITEFKITVHIQDYAAARENSDQMAAQLTSLLVASSGTHSMHFFKGGNEIKTSGMRRVVSNYTFRYQIRNHAITNIEPSKFCDILNGNSELAEKIRYVANALQASKARDYASVIKHLHMACKEKPDTVYRKYRSKTCKETPDSACKDGPNDQSEKFRGLRDALSHNDGQLQEHTRERLNGFGDGYFTLTAANKFDFSSASNLRNLQTQAYNLLDCVRAGLKDDLSKIE